MNNRRIKKFIKHSIKNILGQTLVSILKSLRNKLLRLKKILLRQIYAGDVLKLASHGLMEDGALSIQEFQYNGETIYFRSWGNSYVGAILREIYIDKAYDWFFRDKRGLIVVDLGANIGLFSQYARRFSKKVIAVEPSSETFGYLEKTKIKNRWDNVELINFAIAGETKKM